MADTIAIDAEDPDNQSRVEGGIRTYSPAMERARAAIGLVLRWKRAGKSDQQCIVKARSHINGLQLVPDRLVRLQFLARNIAVYAAEQPAQGRLEQYDCTQSEWSEAARIVCRAAASIIVQTVRPTSYSDFEKLLDVARGMLAVMPLSYREQTRFQKRMQSYLVNILSGLPVNYGLRPSRPTEAHSVQASRARKYIPQAAHGASAAAAH